MMTRIASGSTGNRPAGNREKLLVGAISCLREKGYAATTARDLVAASGTNLNSIGYHFGSKEALLQEAVAAGFEAWMTDIERTTFGDPAVASPRERLGLSLAAVIDRLEELRPFLIAFVEAFPPAVRSPELRERLARAYRDARDATAGMLRKSVSADGLEIPSAEARTVASLMIAICDGLILQWLLDPDEVPSSEEATTALAGMIAAISR